MPTTLLIFFIVVFAINAFPAFMPPTWTVVSFFYLTYHLPLPITVAVGVAGSTCGRIALALISRYWLGPFLPKKFYANYAYLGHYLEHNQKITIPLVLGYAFAPISSNALFIMAGLSNVRLDVLILAFIIGKTVSYSFWTTATYHFVSSLDIIFKAHGLAGKSLFASLFTIAAVVVVGKINWPALLKFPPPHKTKQTR